MNKQPLTQEEQLLCTLAIEHHAKKGHKFEPVHIVPYNIPHNEDACI